MNQITISDKFSLRRMMMLAKREIISNKRLFIMELAVVAGLIILAEAFIAWIILPSPGSVDKGGLYGGFYSDDTTCNVILLVGAIGFSILSTVSASLICSGLSSKKGRINNFMAVGTPAEKYLLNFLIYNVFFVVYFFAVWILVDYVRVLYVDIRYPFDGMSILSKILDIKWQVIVVIGSVALFFQAFYTLVSAFSPKWAFLKGFGLGYAINFLAIPYSLMFSFLYFDVNPSIDYAVVIAGVLALLFTVAMHLLAYYRYTETDLI